jgi:hypothetical protein
MIVKQQLISFFFFAKSSYLVFIVLCYGKVQSEMLVLKGIMAAVMCVPCSKQKPGALFMITESVTLR